MCAGNFWQPEETEDGERERVVLWENNQQLFPCCLYGQPKEVRQGARVRAVGIGQSGWWSSGHTALAQSPARQKTRQGGVGTLELDSGRGGEQFRSFRGGDSNGHTRDHACPVGLSVSLWSLWVQTPRLAFQGCVPCGGTGCCTWRSLCFMECS